MKASEEELVALKMAAEELDSKWAHEREVIVEQIEAIYTKWEILVKR